MPRIARYLMDSSYFHVMSQGINKEFIFKDDKDIMVYKRLIKKYKRELVKIIAYCVMNNHVHILIYADEINNLTKFMHKINTIYAMYYNQKYKRVGYVFRDRYRSEIIESQYYLKQCIDYIHLNPVKAKLCEKPEDYEYSSYNEYIKNKYSITDKLDKSEVSNERINYKIENVKEEFIENETKKEKCRRIIKNFLDKNNMTKNQMLENQEKTKELILKLRKIGGISYRNIEEELGIKKDKLRRLIM